MSTDVTSVPTEELVLRASDVTLRFGGLTVLDKVDLAMRRGEVLAVIGPNGAGKTSFFNSLTGAYTPQEGKIVFLPKDGGEKSLLGSKPHLVNRIGLARTFQNIRLFSALTALENVKIAAETRLKAGPVSIMLGLPSARRAERESDERAHRLLKFVGLEHKLNEIAGSLSYGDQRSLEIARALATEPQVLLLDEPAAGTNPTEKLELEHLIRRINTELGVSVLLIEHDMRLVMSVADRVMVLNFGKKIAEGTPSEVQQHPAVIEAYLGSSAEDAEAVRHAVEEHEHAVEAAAAAVGPEAEGSSVSAATDAEGAEEAAEASGDVEGGAGNGTGPAEPDTEGSTASDGVDGDDGDDESAASATAEASGETASDAVEGGSAEGPESDGPEGAASADAGTAEAADTEESSEPAAPDADSAGAAEVAEGDADEPAEPSEGAGSDGSGEEARAGGGSRARSDEESGE